METFCARMAPWCAGPCLMVDDHGDGAHPGNERSGSPGASTVPLRGSCRELARRVAGQP